MGENGLLLEQMKDIWRPANLSNANDKTQRDSRPAFEKQADFLW